MKMIKLISTLIAVVIFPVIFLNCFGDDEIEEPVQKSVYKPPKNKQKKGADPNSILPPPAFYETCHLLPDDFQKPPFFIRQGTFMVTRLMKKCVTLDQKRGYDKTSPWVAMGFPCTGGNGRADWEGSSIHVPKLVSFTISTNCPMQPSDPATIKQLAVNQTPLAQNSKLMAFNPFVVQFWEIPEIGRSGTGFVINLRNRKDIHIIWNRYQKHESFDIRLYGRENAWLQNHSLFVVEATLIPQTTEGKFTLQINEARTMSEDDIEIAKEKCLQIQTARKCNSIFK